MIKQKGQYLTLGYKEIRILRALLRGDTHLGRGLVDRDIRHREFVIKLNQDHPTEKFSIRPYGKNEIHFFQKFPEAKALLKETENRDRKRIEMLMAEYNHKQEALKEDPS